MYTFISVIIILLSILLVLIVLVQNSKGGGLSAGFTGSNQVMGVRRTTDFLEKATWTLATSLIVLSIVICMFIPRSETETRSKMERQIEEAIDPTSIPQFPTSLPDNSEGNNE
jgi:preprotein translocase subunit SecG